MGWIQKCCETYDNNLHMVGKTVAGQSPLCPAYHILQKAQLEVTIDERARFHAAEPVDKNDARTIIPVTESSGARSSGVAAHALCDQMGYLVLGHPNTPAHEKYADKYEDYMKNLSAWLAFEPDTVVLQAVHAYCEGGTLLSDLAACGMIELNEQGLLTNGKIAGVPYEKCLVRWRVLSGANQPDAVWQNDALFDSYIRFCDAAGDTTESVCYVTGRTKPIAINHPLGIISSPYKAKLISTNDTAGFSFLGRFLDGTEAVSVSIDATQKAHSALRWLAANQGYYTGGRVYVCWNPGGKPIPSANFSALERDDENEELPHTMPAYKQKLALALGGYRQQLDDNDDAVILSLDAATTGRLSITYYNELKASDFLDRIEHFYESCCWYFKQFNQEKKPYEAVFTPATLRIINYAFGTEQSNIVKADERVVKDQYPRIFRCIADGQPLPADIVHAVAMRASTPLAYSSDTNRFNILSTACALIRKYRNDKYDKEDWTMELDLNNTDRSYLFGRLLAVAEKVERTTYTREDGKREPNAIRLQSVFVQHPLHTWAILEKQLNPYYAKLNPGSQAFYRDLTGNILLNLQTNEDALLNKPLGDTYLLGYYLQRRELYAKKATTEEE